VHRELILPPEQRTLLDVLRCQAKAFGTRPLVDLAERTISYAEAPRLAASTAGALREAGVGQGDRVLIFCSNRKEVLEIFLGCVWLGAIFTPINTAARGAQLKHMLENADPTLIVLESELSSSISDVDPQLENLNTVWLVDADDQRRIGVVKASGYPGPGVDTEPANISPADTCAILYTSGTTGASKGVLCPHGQFYWWGRLVGRYLKLTSEDVLFTVLPLFHTNALTSFVQAMMHGAKFSFGLRFSASRFWQNLADSGATVTYLLGAMVHILLERPAGDADQGHHVRIALAPATPADQVAAFSKRFDIDIIDGYGSTETNLVFANNIDGFFPGMLGRITPEFEARVVDELDCPVPDDVMGELLVRPKQEFSIASGYFRMPEATIASWRNLWFHTGDNVVHLSNGLYQFMDRKKDAIRRRGENISSFEVEQALLTHPQVAAAAVVGVPSRLGEDEVMAFVVSAANDYQDPVALIRHLGSRLAYFAIPRYIEFVAELPLTENGKVRKNVLQERGIGQDTWDREAAGITLRR